MIPPSSNMKSIGLSATYRVPLPTFQRCKPHPLWYLLLEFSSRTSISCWGEIWPFMLLTSIFQCILVSNRCQTDDDNSGLAICAHFQMEACNLLWLHADSKPSDMKTSKQVMWHCIRIGTPGILHCCVTTDCLCNLPHFPVVFTNNDYQWNKRICQREIHNAKCGIDRHRASHDRLPATPII